MIRQRHSNGGVAVVLGSLLLLSITACTQEPGDKIPISTRSVEAREYFLKGRDLFERLQAQEAIAYFEKAITADPNFAVAYLNLSFVVPSAKEFFANLDKAVALADRVSEGERLWILGVQAGFNGFPMQQREYYQKLVELYPNDERVHNLLGGNYFGQQEWTQAVDAYQKATAIAPEFSQPYNQLGYAYRFLEQYDDAKRSFEKYIELIPNDPNPYDSYAELLMKMGEFKESIESYRLALAINPNFVASHLGIATDLNFLEHHAEARQQLQQLYDIARNDGEHRAALFATAVSYADEGDFPHALEELRKVYVSNAGINDAAGMAGNLIVLGNVLLEMGKTQEAGVNFEEALKTVLDSGLSDEVKDNNRRAYLFNMARVAIREGDLETAEARTVEFRQAVQAIGNANQLRLAFQLSGMIALARKDYAKAVEDFQQGNQQDPYILYRLALAYQDQDDCEKAAEYFAKAANFNGLNNLNYAFIRHRAQDMLKTMMSRLMPGS